MTFHDAKEVHDTVQALGVKTFNTITCLAVVCCLAKDLYAKKHTGQVRQSGCLWDSIFNCSWHITELLCHAVCMANQGIKLQTLMCL